MHNIIKSGMLLLAFVSAAAAAADVHVSVGGEIKPGVYGRIDIGSAPPPLVYAQPVVIVEQPRAVRPVYMHVPPGHAKNWGKHCHKYNACSQPVYFVKSSEYRGYDGGRHYRDDRRHDRHVSHVRHDHKHEHKRDKHEHKHERGHGNGRGHGKHD